ncbi:hypothetical protein ACW0TN_09795 [Fusobacterium pseudoperiodonticum]|jgi:hypothetical protein|uniref:Uncharacterized protein n=2 Tax=Fusobacterium TaxID=848 RepID=D6LHJ5_9FUSO|nr:MULTISPECIES: hypothetical protein [Fusobacterium]ATV70061.1 hypothetical protein CTM98_05000 [Fusobacterium pseudoperiodonticum]EFG27871.1 hypothetical protein HMPREF0400_01203 [Fusobacterium periodonticum 1_1_41FAA]MBF1213880.1 hypothetical protein [Fusobacterium periodonticum]
MELCDLTLKKEVLREGIWEVLANFSKVENKMGTNSFLSLSSQKLFNQITKIPNMTEEEVKNLTAIKNFLNDILKEFKDE